MPFVGLEWLGRITIVVWFLSAFTRPTTAFFPTAWRQAHFGNNGVSHEQQTAEAFERLAQKYWPKRALTRSMSDARVAIASANADVDRDWDHSAFHCDGENFDGAQARLTELKNETIFQLRAGKAYEAQKFLGSALHTLQDFYSHSNWIEMGNTGPHPDFGTGRKMVYAGAKNATCATCSSTVQKDKAGCPLCIPVTNSTRKANVDLVGPIKAVDTMDTSTDMLTSGYAFGEDMPRNKSAIPEFKCHHGGHIDNSWGAGMGFILGMVRGDSIPGINKDSLDCGFSPHAHLHMAAVNASVKATMRYIDEIKQQINDAQLRMLFGTGSTLAFAVDTTSVLKPITASIKSHTIRIAENDLHVPEDKEANHYMITAFNSGSNTATTMTNDFEHFKSTVNNLGRTVSMRDSCAGLPLKGIFDTLKALDDGSTLFLMAGAYPPDDSLATEIISLAYAKDITIHSFHYRGGCVNDYVRLRASFKMKSVYDSFAAATGGLSFTKGLPQLQISKRVGQRGDRFQRLHIDSHTVNQSVASTETPDIFDHSDEPATIQSSIQNKGDGTRILKIADNLLKTQKQIYTFPIDTTITDLKIALVSRTTSITLIQPNGSNLELPDDRRLLGPPSTITSTALENGHFITLSRPATGTWKAIVEGVGEFKLEVYGTSNLHLHSFAFSQLLGRQGHEGYFPVETPRVGEDVGMIAEVRGGFKSAKFEFRNAVGKAVAWPVLSAGSGKAGEAGVNQFWGTGKLIKGQYHMYLTGKDEKGEGFQRV